VEAEEQVERDAKLLKREMRMRGHVVRDFTQSSGLHAVAWSTWSQQSVAAECLTKVLQRSLSCLLPAIERFLHNLGYPRLREVALCSG